MGKVVWYKEIDSTNNEARRLLCEFDNLSYIATEGQSAGRGQGTHTWHSTPGKNITMTIILKPEKLTASDFLFITRITTIALLSYLQSHGVQARIKWPNDIWVGDRKICGILIENQIDRGLIVSSIIGVGLNLNEENWPDHLPNPVSLKELTGRDYDIHAETEEFFKEFSRHYEMVLSSDGRSYLERMFVDNVFRLPEELERQLQAQMR